MTAQMSVTPLRAETDSCDAQVPLATLFKALGDTLRLQIIRLLKGDSLSVSELCEVFQLRQSALSHHLKVLVQADLLVRRREGTAVFYRRQLPNAPRATLLSETFDSIDREPMSAELLAGLGRVQRQREDNSLTFFRDNSDRFREQKELIASWRDYTQAALHLLDRCGDLSVANVLEIGPGDGSLLPELSRRSGRVTALDNSSVMLDSARDLAGDLDNVEFVHGDTHTLASNGRRFTAVLANMVLHHTPDPRAVFQDAAALLEPGGCLIISDLCAHDQAWAREHCGDLWLGFEPAQLSDWAHEAQLDNRAELFIAQRNGFQIQVRLFQRRTPNS